ncbi:hypothetical protein VBD025_06230 [Virgibacillus flavescens]|uniref:hypothetical protein n=1 Tax=Virgibacillus flavescens TaxID=1611422 RepID=UPI003D3333DA
MMNNKLYHSLVAGLVAAVIALIIFFSIEDKALKAGLIAATVIVVLTVIRKIFTKKK